MKHSVALVIPYFNGGGGCLHIFPTGLKLVVVTKTSTLFSIPIYVYRECRFQIT